MFSGTVRSNLDPFEEFGGDHDLWEALRECGLADQVGWGPGPGARGLLLGGGGWQGCLACEAMPVEQCAARFGQDGGHEALGSRPSLLSVRLMAGARV